MDFPRQIPLKKFEDSRGFFFESYNRSYFEGHGVGVSFVQDNVSLSLKKGTVRGLHFQVPPYDQAKLVICLKGSILDVVVDLRKNSPHYLEKTYVKLDGYEPSAFYVPVGFAHGFCTLEDDVIVQYKVSNIYSPAHDGGLFWKDEQLAIEWPFFEEYYLSDKDKKLPHFGNLTNPF